MEPVGGGDDFYTAQICSVIANVNGNKTKPQDFMSRELIRKQLRRQRIARGEEGNGVSFESVKAQMRATVTRKLPGADGTVTPTISATPATATWADKEIR